MRENEDYILNYAALLACIVSGVSADKAIKQITLQELKVPDYVKYPKRVANGKKLGKSRCVPVRVTNVITGETVVYESGAEASKELGLYRTVVFNYIKSKKIYKGMYGFERVECR